MKSIFYIFLFLHKLLFYINYQTFCFIITFCFSIFFYNIYIFMRKGFIVRDRSLSSFPTKQSSSVDPRVDKMFV